MDKKTALAKIKKCLALAKSANEHEAAQALKQAQALMREFEVTEQDVEWSQVNEASQPYNSRCVMWQVGLVNMCAKAFGCSQFSHTKWDNGQFKTRSTLWALGHAQSWLLMLMRCYCAKYAKHGLSIVKQL